MDIGKAMGISIIILVIILSVPLIPIIVLTHLLAPITFWQNLATLGVMGILYVILLTIWVGIIVVLLQS